MNAQKTFSARQPLLAVFSGALLFLSFSLPRGIILTPVAWFALAPLILSLKKATTRNAFLYGFIAGIIGCFGIYYWIPYCMIHYADMPRPLAYFALLLLVLILASYIALFAWLLRIFQLRSRVSQMAIGPLIWVGLEYIRTYFPLGGFSWALLGASQYHFLPVIQISELGGVYLVSWLVALVNFGIAALFENFPPPKKAWQAFVLAALCFLAAAVYGQIRIGQVDRIFSNQPQIRVGIAQGNIDQSQKWSREFLWSGLARHIELSKDLLKKPKELLVWPETAVTTFFNISWQNQDQLSRALKFPDSYFLFGSVSKEERSGKKLYFNSAFMLAPGGETLLGRYDKIHLVPFGEYIPMRQLLFWIDAVARGNAGNTQPGNKIVLFELGQYQIGCVICYELIFPNLVRKFVKSGAQMMSTITNDAWFGPTSAPYQHHSHIVFRAVENRVYFVRAANTGISSICDPVGRIISQSPIYEIATVEGIVKPSPIRTLYTRLGDWFALLSLGLTLAALATILLKRPEEKSGGMINADN